MCSLINVCSINILDNPAKITDPFKIEIVFEAFENIKEEIGWELVFVATDGNEEHDQVLDSVGIEQIREGRHKFVFDAPAPKIETLRADDLLDVTLLLLKCTYREQLFLKVGWFMTHSYADPELVANPPEQPIPEKMQRTVVTEDYRVTTYAIRWTNMPEETVQSAPGEENSGNEVRVTDESVTLDGDGAVTSSATPAAAIDIQSDEEDEEEEDDDEEEESSVGNRSIDLGSSTDDNEVDEPEEAAVDEPMDTSSSGDGATETMKLLLLDGGEDAKKTSSTVESNDAETTKDRESEVTKMEDHDVVTTAAAPFADKTNNGQ